MPHHENAKMNIDDAKQRSDELVPQWIEARAKIDTEQHTRFQVIDRILTEVMGWLHTDVHTEPHGPSGYVDYLLSREDRNCFVIEAKKQQLLLVDTRNPKLARYKLGGAAIKSADEGIQQARKYCLDHGVPFAALTTGFEWMALSCMDAPGVARGKLI